MVYQRRVLKRRPVSLTDEEWHTLHVAGTRWSPQFMPRDGFDAGPVPVPRVLCLWCRSYHSPAEVPTCMAMPRPVPLSVDGSTSSLTATMPKWLSRFPELWEFLSKASYQGGAQRQLGKVSLGLVSDGIQMTLTDPSSSTYCSRHYPTLEEALLGFEAGLKDGSLPWKPSGPQRGKKGR